MVAGFLLLAGVSADPAAIEADLRARLLAECAAISERATEGWLFFNPAGYQTYYKRDACLENAAYELRDEKLCEGLRTRRSPFLDGSAISEPACRRRVEAQQAKDQAEAARLLAKPRRRLTRVTLRRNNNGRDFDVVIAHTDGEPAPYDMVLTVSRPGAAPVEIFAERQPIGGDAGEIARFFRSADLAAALGPGWDETAMTLTATIHDSAAYAAWPVRRLVAAEAAPVSVSATVRVADLTR